MMTENKSFTEFISSKEVTPPAHLTHEILNTVRGALHPPVWRVFTKLGSLQLTVGAVVLMFCPQFGTNLFPGMGLMSLFMRFGDVGCMIGCGGVFLGGSGLLGSLIFSLEEIRVIRGSRFLQLSSMTLLSGAAFVCLAGDQLLTLGVAWVLGGLVGGMTTLELGWLVRKAVWAGK
ncbi:hypothetical protein WDW86_08615 [Bdellovibrionota bacterium FG-2]